MDLRIWNWMDLIVQGGFWIGIDLRLVWNWMVEENWNGIWNFTDLCRLDLIEPGPDMGLRHGKEAQRPTTRGWTSTNTNTQMLWTSVSAMGRLYWRNLLLKEQPLSSQHHLKIQLHWCSQSMAICRHKYLTDRGPVPVSAWFAQCTVKKRADMTMSIYRAYGVDGPQEMERN